ncbi:unnamed protein product [Symbiodinium natans]|uniref:Uncharacterized protein n=1 Tax=Symbiodinium natans TaxID=878477 RepID=A0A812I0P1_9DINO|nr:unnamed protein product [Symbiodinium natans]
MAAVDARERALPSVPKFLRGESDEVLFDLRQLIKDVRTEPSIVAKARTGSVIAYPQEKGDMNERTIKANLDLLEVYSTYVKKYPHLFLKSDTIFGVPEGRDDGENDAEEAEEASDVEEEDEDLEAYMDAHDEDLEAYSPSAAGIVERFSPGSAVDHSDHSEMAVVGGPAVDHSEMAVPAMEGRPVAIIDLEDSPGPAVASSSRLPAPSVRPQDILKRVKERMQVKRQPPCTLDTQVIPEAEMAAAAHLLMQMPSSEVLSVHGSPVVESRAPSLNRGGLLVCSPEDDTHFPETQVDVDMVDGQVAPSVVAVEPASQAGQGLRRNLTGLFEEVADECHVDPSPIGAEQELQEPDLCFMDVEHDRKDTYPFEQELQDPCGPTPIHAEQELPETDLCPIHAEQKLPETDLCEKEQQENDLASIPSIDASFTRKDQRRMKKTKVAEQRRRKINHAPGEAHEGQEEEDDAEAVSSEQRGRGRGGRGRGGGGRGARGRGGRGSGGGGRKRGRSRSQSAESEPQVLRRPAAKSLAKPSKPQDAKRKAQANPKPEPKPKKAKVDESVRKACEGQGVDEVVTFILSDIDALKTKTALKISKLPVMQRIDEIPIQHELRSEYKKSFGSIWTLDNCSNFRLDPYWTRGHCGLKYAPSGKHILLAKYPSMQANIAFCNSVATWLQF